MANTGPPYYAVDAAEAARAQTHQKQVGKRRAFAARQQARLRGNPQKALQLLHNMIPATRRDR